jgi:uracil-DNA glycosylase
MMFNLSQTAPDWQPLLSKALAAMDPDYLAQLQGNPAWLPGQNAIFNAFKLPLAKTRYILFGESPYPRATSANGFAFWDANVNELWSSSGLSKRVNKATSLRNIIKMLLLARGDLNISDLSQAAICNVDKAEHAQTIKELFNNALAEGVLLLNASLALSESLSVSKESRYWLPFIECLLGDVTLASQGILLILMGKVAGKVRPLANKLGLNYFVCEHPYNLSFITNPDVLDYFKPFNLLKKCDKILF